MRYVSQNNAALESDLAGAMLSGLAPDGGLFAPDEIPTIDLATFDVGMSYPHFAQQVLAPFFAGSPLAPDLVAICEQAFNFPIPLTRLNDTSYLLELFHGPTLSFKDVGARFLAQCLTRLSKDHKSTVIVVTSGDTGSAVACALYQKPNVDVVILYPKGRVSQRQQHQITCWQGNVRALEVDGNFDACQALAKAAFAHPVWLAKTRLTTSNSMNIGRLLPQITYYAYTSYQFYQQHGQAPGFVIPSGNLGNVTAAYWAKKMGFPVGDIVLATNANRVVSDFLETNTYTPRASIETLANAMDVGNPSNFSRLQRLFPALTDFKQAVSAYSVSDEQIKTTIQQVYKQYGQVICPHTATGVFVRAQLSSAPWIIAATAHPAKFESIVEPLLGISLPVPSELQTLLERPVHFVSVPAELEAITQCVLKNN